MAAGHSREQRRGRLLAVLVSVAVHGALWLLSWRTFGSRDVNVQLPVEVSFEAAIAPIEPPPIPPARDESPARAIARQPEHPRPRAPAQQAEPPSAPSSEPTNGPTPGSNLPVDLTGETLLAVSSTPSGRGSSGSGEGGSDVGRRGGGVPNTSSVGGDGTSDRSEGVSLPNQNWSCPWPHEADAEKIDEETATIRVVVSTTGTVESVTVVSDPGHGFGPAAVACALRTRFMPARDREGRPVRAASPPILVRFTR
jgi:protein TonB